MNYNLLDIIIVLIVILSAIKGYRSGLFGSIIKFFSTIIALFVSIKYYKIAAEALEANFKVVTGLASFLGDKLSLPLEVSTMPISGNSIFLLQASIDQMTLPDFLKDQVIVKIQEIMTIATELNLKTTGELLIYLIALVVINGLAFILLWLIVQGIINFLARFMSKSMEHTFLGKINHLTGLFIGSFLSILGLIITIGLVNLILGILPEMDSSFLVTLREKFNGAYLVPYLQMGYEGLLAQLISFI